MEIKNQVFTWFFYIGIVFHLISYFICLLVVIQILKCMTPGFKKTAVPEIFQLEQFYCRTTSSSLLQGQAFLLCYFANAIFLHLSVCTFREGNHPLDILFHCMEISQNGVLWCSELRKNALTRLAFCRGIIFFAESIIGGFSMRSKNEEKKKHSFLEVAFYYIDLHSISEEKFIIMDVGCILWVVFNSQIFLMLNGKRILDQIIYAKPFG